MSRCNTYWLMLIMNHDRFHLRNAACYHTAILRTFQKPGTLWSVGVLRSRGPWKGQGVVGQACILHIPSERVTSRDTPQADRERLMVVIHDAVQTSLEAPASQRQRQGKWVSTIGVSKRRCKLESCELAFGFQGWMPWHYYPPTLIQRCMHALVFIGGFFWIACGNRSGLM